MKIALTVSIESRNQLYRWACWITSWGYKPFAKEPLTITTVKMNVIPVLLPLFLPSLVLPFSSCPFPQPKIKTIDVYGLFVGANDGPIWIVNSRLRNNSRFVLYVFVLIRSYERKVFEIKV